MDSETFKVTCYIYFCECVVNSLYKISSSFNIREDTDFEQRKVSLLHRLSTMKAESSASIANNKRQVFCVGGQQ
jgi:hypothetical protein